MRGRFIVLEGGEGSGKTTQIQRVADWLRARGRGVCPTREPGGTPLGEKIRVLLIDGAPGSVPADAELLLLFAARSAHLRDVILPALSAGDDVVCDRFVDASYAYQGGGRGLPTERIDALAQWVCGSLAPDLVLLLDIDPAQGLARAAARAAHDRFEQEGLAFAERVRAAYLERAAAQPERSAVINADGTEEAVWQRIRSVLEERL